MKVRLVLPGLVAVLVSALLGSSSAFAGESAFFPFNIASESTYRLDVAGGSMSVRVEAEFQSTGPDLDSVALWAMPGATGLAVTQGDTVLETTAEVGSTEAGELSLITAKLPKPLKGKNRTELTMTYSVPSQKNDYVNLEPGLAEALFVSQGAGSFVFIEMPIGGDNYVEPGCLRTQEQPGHVKDAGFERFVCGDATAIAFSTEDKSVQERCARLDDRCRQQLFLPFSGFAQSITDDAKKGILEADVAMANGPVKLTLRYFSRDRAWAETEFALAQRALPLLEQTFNFPYPHERVDLRQSNFIEFGGAAGLAFPGEGQMLIAHSGDAAFDNEVTVHELAHQWAGRNLETSWLWEGLAQWATEKLAPSLGFTIYDRQWQAWGYTDPLATWWTSGVTNPDYWYGKASAFWAAYETAIGGPDQMKAVLGQLDDPGTRLPANGRWFQDTGESASGANLDELFLSWVYVRDTAAPLLAERRAAHELITAMLQRTTALGFAGLPTDIQANLSTWQFRPVAGQVAQAQSILDEYDHVTAEAAAAGLTAPTAVAQSWGTTTMANTRRLIEDERQAIEAIVNGANAIADEPPESASHAQLTDARKRFAEGFFADAKRLAAASGTTAYNEAAAGRMLEIAREKAAGFRPDFLSRIGLFFQDPEGDLAKAEAAYAEGDATTALRLSRGAYESWNGASERGLMRLALLAGAMCALSVGTWYLLRRLDPEKPQQRSLGSGHVLSEESRGGGWRDWENTP